MKTAENVFNSEFHLFSMRMSQYLGC